MENREMYFDYLDQLRESGITNMFGASPYLQEAFDLDRYEAKDILLEDRKSTRLNSSHVSESRMPSSA